MKFKFPLRLTLTLILTAFSASSAWAATYEMRVMTPGVRPIATTPGAPTAPAASPILGPWSLSPVEYGSGSYALRAPSSNSPGAFTFASSNPAVALVSGNTLSVIAAGFANITATQAAAPGFTSASASSALTVTQADPVVGPLAAMSKTYGDAPFALTAPNSTGVFSYSSSDSSVATVAGNQVTVRGGGVALITATQEATANYRAGSITAQLTVSPATPTIGPLAPISKTYGAANFTLTAPSGTGPFTYTSSDLDVATISGNQVTIRGAGTATITATQAATANYGTGSVTGQLTVAKATPTFSVYELPTTTMGTASYALPEPNASAAGGTFTYASSNPAVATVSGNMITLVSAGSTTITATRAADANHTVASTTANLVVSPAVGPTTTSWSYTDKGANLTVSSALVIRGSGPEAQWEIARANLGKSSGKYVFELKANTNGTNASCGLSSGNTPLVGQLGTSGVALGIAGGGATRSTMTSTLSTTGYSCANTLMFAVDLDAGKGWITSPSVGANVWAGGGSPQTGTYPTFRFNPGTVMYPTASVNTVYTYTVTANFGATAFTKAVPAGYTAGWY
jgi:hypothetical protein